MKYPRLGLVLVWTLSLVYAMPPETTTTRSTPPIGETIKKLTNQLMEVNATKLDMVYDARTPPRVKQQQQNKMKLKEEMENSHAGIAIPVDEDALEMEETTKKLNFYKLERPTTNSGLSTWILLSGQTSMTTRSPTTKKPIIKQNTQEDFKQNLTVVVNEKPNRIIKPIFKKRISATTTTTTATPSTTTISSTTSKVTKEATKLTKVKASILNNAVQRRNTTGSSPTKKPTLATTTTTTTTVITTEQPISTTHLIVKNNSTTENSTVSTDVTTNVLPAEAKEGSVDLTNNAETKKKKTSGKRKKNKTRRRKPTDKDTTNTTSISKPTKTHKQKPIGTQLYNYLAREIMPSVGVGLVGLMVTAGLASYFFYPFGAARRSYDIDRKDKEGSYYYNDEYSGGMPEEEAIGKVIAGMPSNSLLPNSYKSPTSRNTYPNVKYRLADRRAQIQSQSTTENVPQTPKWQEQKTRYDSLQNYQSNSFEPMIYNDNEQMNGYNPMEKKFVVGNVPKDVVQEVAPAAVPEHGPRSLERKPTVLVGDTDLNGNVGLDAISMYNPRSIKIRRKRSGMSNDIDNEIISSFDREVTSTVGGHTTEDSRETTTLFSDVSSTEVTTLGTPTTTVGLPEKVTSFLDLMKEVIHYKAKLGLQIIQNITQSISKYITRVQARLDEHYRRYSKSKN